MESEPLTKASYRYLRALLLAILLIGLETPTRAESGTSELAYAWDVIYDLTTGPFIGGQADPNNPRQVQYHYAQNSLVKIEGKALGLCLALVAQSRVQPPALDRTKMHCLQRELVGGHWVSHGESEKKPAFISYLGADDRDCDYTSGFEDQLEFWAWAQPDNSITPLKIYEQGLRLSSGNIWNAVLTIHNVLRDNARWWDAERYRYESTPERQAKFFDKFVDIRGDLEQRGPKFVGDHFGSWYRLWGVMLYRLSAVSDQDFQRGIQARRHVVTLQSFSRWLKGKLSDWKAAAVFTAEEYRKKVIHNDDDIGKLRIDLAGGRAASWLVTGLWHPALIGRKKLTRAGCEAAYRKMP